MQLQRPIGRPSNGPAASSGQGSTVNLPEAPGQDVDALGQVAHGNALACRHGPLNSQACPGDFRSPEFWNQFSYLSQNRKPVRDFKSISVGVPTDLTPPKKAQQTAGACGQPNLQRFCKPEAATQLPAFAAFNLSQSQEVVICCKIPS